MVWFILGGILGFAFGYLVKHVTDNDYFKQMEYLWIEDAKECDRLINENKRLSAILNSQPIDYTVRTKEACRYSNEELIEMFNNTKLTVPDDPKIDFGGFEL